MKTMTTDTTDAAGLKFKRNPELNERVRVFLNEKLAQHEVDCENVYITKINNPIDNVVVFSQDLWHLGCDTLEWGNVQVHTQGVTGIFSASHTFEDEQRFHKLSIHDVEKLVEALLNEATASWGDLVSAS